jgi:hypothetical protein
LSVIYMRVTGADQPQDLFLDSGGEKVPIRDGGALHLSPKRNQRLIFSVTGPDNKSLCEWVAQVGTSKRDPPPIPEGFAANSDLSRQFRGSKHQGFQNAGDPILLFVGGKLANESAQYSIDDLPATVLARNAGHVILEDPHPAAGMRTIESRGYSISVPFIALEMKLRNSTVPGPTSIEITLLGRDQIQLPALPFRRLILQNLDPGRLQLLCGRSSHEDYALMRMGGDEARLTASCRAKLLKPGPVDIDASLIESSVYHHGVPLPRLPLP